MTMIPSFIAMKSPKRDPIPCRLHSAALLSVQLELGADVVSVLPPTEISNAEIVLIDSSKAIQFSVPDFLIGG